MDIFLGHPIPYWLELQKRADALNCVHLLKEIADLYGRVGFYEKRIAELNQFMVTWELR